MNPVEIRRWEGSVEIGAIRSGKTHGESYMHVPFAMHRVMYGCKEFGRYRLSFPA